MTSSYISDSCFVCQRGLVKGQGVKGSTSLPHSGTLVFEAIGEIVEEETAFSELCFRCYRLILRIDYHKRELKLLRKTFFELYNERGNLQSNIQNIVESRVIVCNVGNDNFMQSPACSESADSGDHVYYKNIFDNQLENLNFNETKFEVHCSSAERNIQNSSMHKSEEQELRNVTSEEKCDNECYIRDIAHDIVTEKVIKDVTVDGQDKLPSKRRKKAKKNEDYDYYTEDGSGLDSGWPNHIGNYSSEFKTCKSTYCKVKVNCNLCKRNFITKKEYIGHECFKKKKKGNISYVCKGCQSIFTLRRDYIKHIDFCYKNVPVNCQICLVKLSSAAYLPRHMKSFHEGVAVTKKAHGLGQHKCSKCKLLFSAENALERHKENCVTDWKEQTSTGQSNTTSNDESEKLRNVNEFWADNEIGKELSRKSNIVLTADKQLSSGVISKITPNHSKSFSDVSSQTNTERLQLLQTQHIHKCSSALNKKHLQPNIHVVSSDNGHQCIVEAKDTIVFVPPVAELKETQVVYQVSAQDPSLSSSGEIVLETLDDLGSDFQFVIFVEEGSNDLQCSPTSKI
ncbi:uncharacterized protein LOC121863279 isoform X3 [Homarus americanus]|uniref:uncharacterized protein LOC121863279 isoform X3 n=1 Tax=Homarus americanus TaxID=6706 RepID=UPI001C477B86|nr:uncharacterized protein LOC121863279 isoform X3 [Homarus americanus]